jgi:hypothetical protein
MHRRAAEASEKCLNHLSDVKIKLGRRWHNRFRASIIFKIHRFNLGSWISAADPNPLFMDDGQAE